METLKLKLNIKNGHWAIEIFVGGDKSVEAEGHVGG